MLKIDLIIRITFEKARMVSWCIDSFITIDTAWNQVYKSKELFYYPQFISLMQINFSLPRKTLARDVECLLNIKLMQIVVNKDDDMLNINWLLYGLSICLILTNVVFANSTHNLIIQSDIKHDVSFPLRFTYLKPSIQHKPLLPPSLLMPVHSSVVIELTGFKGLGVDLGGLQITSLQPDPVASVGMLQYVQWVNNYIGVFNKTNGALLSGFPKAGNALWSGFGGLCETHNVGLTTIKYDQLAGRWVFSQHAYADAVNGPFYECIAVSTSEDATGSYYRYAFSLPALTNYARFGLWPDAYYMAFNLQGNNVNGAFACAFDRNQMIAGAASTMQCKSVSDMQPNPITPIDLEGVMLPETGQPAYFMGLLPPLNLLITQFHVDFSNPTNTKVTTDNLQVRLYAKSCPQSNGKACAIQPNINNNLDVYSDRLMHRLVYRQFSNYGSVLATHTIVGSLPEKAPAIRWYELRLLPDADNFMPVVYQQGNINPDSMNRFLGSITMDKNANIAVGYSLTSSLIYPSLEFGTHLITDPLNTMTIQALATGLGSQLTGSAWGNVSNISIDPVDDCTYWYMGEYILRSGTLNWSTVIVQFKLAGCT